MSDITPTFRHIKALVTDIRQKAKQSKAKTLPNIIGIHTKGQWTGDRQYTDESLVYEIRSCVSPLAIRMALQEQLADNAILVVLTPINNGDLEEDIGSRLFKHRLFPVRSWEIAASLFQSSMVDPRLLKHPWIADYLLDWNQEEQYPAARGGFLDTDTVWPILLRRGLGLTASRPDLIALLQWSLDEENVQRFQEAPEQFRCALIEDWLIDAAGIAVKPILASLLHTEHPDVFPLGLVFEVLYHPDAQGQMDKAIGKMEERFLGGVALEPTIIKTWKNGALDALQDFKLNAAHQSQVLQRADSILEELGISSFAYFSSVTKLGLNQRLARFGQQLIQAINDLPPSVPNTLALLHQSINAHYQAKQSTHTRQLERTKMALRLVRWLISNQDPTAPKSLKEAIAYEIQCGSFVDWARFSLRHGDSIEELSNAYSALFAIVQNKREQDAQQFGTLLQNWVEVGTTKTHVHPVETILDRIVAPLVAQQPILLVVMDGMGTATCRELLEDIDNNGWYALCPIENHAESLKQATALQAGLASIPSITQISRTSLLCGQLHKGGQSQESKGFSKHPSLLKQCQKNYPPQLFYKAALQDNQDASLAEEVREAIGDTRRKVVGVILNAVDDHLSKGEQVAVQWNCSTIKGLSSLLEEAKNSNRLVILLSDHGHVLEHQATYQNTDGGEQRWRPDDGQPNEYELQLKGDRILVSDNQSLIAPWSEKIRYKSKINGYHGGISPQEMVIPIAVLSGTETSPKDWTRALNDKPLWWEEFFTSTQSDTVDTDVSDNPGKSHAHFGPLFSENTSKT